MNIVFIVGSSRSGTSIYGELIRAHPYVMYVFEEPIWRRLAETDSHCVAVGDISDKKRLKLKRWMRMYKRPGKVVVEKNPRHIVRVPFVKSIFPEAKIIHIVRDGRDVACSLRPGLCGKTWAHTKPPNWRDIEKNYSGVVRCAHAWNDIMKIAINDLKSIEHLQVKYEDLINDPVKIAHETFEYIGIDMHDNVINFAADKVQNEMEKSYVSGGQTRWYKRDHKVRVGRWKENMSEQEQKQVNEILEDVLEYYGYI